MKKQRIIAVSAFAVRKVLPFRAKGDADRPALNHIVIEPLNNEEGVIIAATDGHVIGCYRDQHGSSNDRWVVDISEEFERAIHCRDAIEIVVNNEEGFTRSASIATRPPNARYLTEYSRGEFPRWQNAIPFDAKPTKDATLRCNPKLIRRIASAFPDKSIVSLHPCTQVSRYGVESSDGAGAIIAQGADKDFFVAFAPMKEPSSTWETRFPEWLKP